MKKQKVIQLFLGLTLSTNSVFATEQVSDIVSLSIQQAQLNADFVQLQNKSMTCEYGTFLAKNNLTNDTILNQNYQIENPSVCRQQIQAFNNLLLQPEILSVNIFNFPLYTQLSRQMILKNRAALNQTGFSSLPEAPPARTGLDSVRLTTWNLENQMRSALKIDQPVSGQMDCYLDNQALQEASNNSYNNIYWHAQLLRRGYDCTVHLYKKSSEQLNATKGFNNVQTIFEAQRKQINQIGHQNIQTQPLKDLQIVVFPQLAYESPTQLENLNYDYLKKAISKLGGSLYVVKRVTTESTNTQVEKSAAEFRRLVQAYQFAKKSNPSFLVLTRSMGGMVAREVFERHPELQKFISGIVMVGATPYGSMIADYKSRGDLFDGNYLERMDIKEVLAVNALSFFKPEFKQIHEAAKVRKNIQTMSFKNFNINNSIQLNSNIPVLNVIQLPDHLSNYFKNQERSKTVDPTFLLMSMYGPSEGSTPLSHASWDTARSIRVFASDFNHLGFWSISPDQSVNYLLASILTAKKMGL